MVSLIIGLTGNLVVNAIRGLRYGKRFRFSVVERFSRRASIKLYESGSCEIGRNVELSKYVDIQAHGSGVITIGDGSYLNQFCMISCHGRVSIGSHCMFGPSVKIFDNNHRFSKTEGVSSKLNIGSVSVGNNCWICSNVVLLKGARIGDNCVIGAGCVIDREIPAGTIVKCTQTQITEKIL